ncbi:hypothetical protein ABXS75_10955 [Roseburia hominis]
MSERERAMMLLEQIDDKKMIFVVNILENIAELAEEDDGQMQREIDEAITRFEREKNNDECILLEARTVLADLRREYLG